MIGWRDHYCSALGDLDFAAGDETFTPSQGINLEINLFGPHSRRVCRFDGRTICRQTITHLLEVIRYR